MRPDRKLRPHRKAALAVEILVLHRRARRAMAGNDVRAAVADMRRVGGRRTGGRPPLAPWQAARLGHAVARTVTSMPVDERCLAQSLVLTGLLARRGTPARLVIGARPSETFGAHAWVEVDGLPVLPTDDDEYPRLVEL